MLCTTFLLIGNGKKAVPSMGICACNELRARPEAAGRNEAQPRGGCMVVPPCGGLHTQWRGGHLPHGLLAKARLREGAPVRAGMQ